MSQQAASVLLRDEEESLARAGHAQRHAEALMGQALQGALGDGHLRGLGQELKVLQALLLAKVRKHIEPGSRFEQRRVHGGVYQALDDGLGRPASLSDGCKIHQQHLEKDGVLVERRAVTVDGGYGDRQNEEEPVGAVNATHELG